MWKLISLSVLLVVAQAGNIENLYGDWIQVAFYPVSTYAPVCLHFEFEKNTEGVECVYSDGRKVTPVDVSMKNENKELIQLPISMPILVVDTVAEVMPALNLTSRCGDKDVRDRAVAKLVNDKYFILYHPISPSMDYTRTETEPNAALVFGREVVSAHELHDVLANIEELKNRRGAEMCAKENYGGWKPSENEVL